MIRETLLQYLNRMHMQAITDQNVINLLLWFPAWVGVQLFFQPLPAAIANGRTAQFFMRAVEVAHQHHMRCVLDNAMNVRKLVKSGLNA